LSNPDKAPLKDVASSVVIDYTEIEPMAEKIFCVDHSFQKSIAKPDSLVFRGKISIYSLRKI
jgi:hypothetical protein